MPSGSVAVTPAPLALVPQVFGVNPEIAFVGPVIFRLRPQTFSTSGALDGGIDLGDLVNFRVDRLERSYKMVDGEGRPNFEFQRWWQSFAEGLEQAIRVLGQTGLDTQAVINRLLAAEEAARQANLVAEQAQADAEAQKALQRVRDSAPDINPLTASTSGSVSTIAVAAHNRVYIDPEATVPVNGGSIGSLTPNTVYFVFYEDPETDGGAVTYQVTTNEVDATATASTPYRHKVGLVQTPAESGGSSSGDPVRPPWKVNGGERQAEV